MGISQTRGAIFEEVVLHLLELVGYRIVNAGEEGTKRGHSGLEVRGRGEWHQIDALAAADRTPAFMYPLRLMVEAKCYRGDRRIGIEVVRNSVGVHKDISENYFSPRLPGPDYIQGPRFNYLSAIASTSGFTKNAQRYAIAHQIFLIQYKDLPMFRPISEGLLGLDEAHFRQGVLNAGGVGEVSIREHFRYFIRVRGDVGQDYEDEFFTAEGINQLRESILRPLFTINGSYYGALQGRWPIHLLSQEALPARLFAERDEVRCRIRREEGVWGFEPIGAPNHFRLEFSLPDEIARIVREAGVNRELVADIKEEYFSYMDITGKIGGVQRNVRLSLDHTWMDAVRRQFL